jgi:exopolysaccharide biosynthesis predicted pyruvyltransferase EpsI
MSQFYHKMLYIVYAFSLMHMFTFIILGLQRFNEVMSALYEDMSSKETMLAIRLSDINYAHEQLRSIDSTTFTYGDTNFRNIIFDLSSQEAYELIMKQVILISIPKNANLGDSYHWVLSILYFYRSYEVDHCSLSSS